MQVIEFLRNALQALARYGPDLSIKVLLASFASGVALVAGLCIVRILERRTDSENVRDWTDHVLIAYTAAAFYALLLMYTLGGLGVYTTPALWLAVLMPIALRWRDALKLPVRIENPGWKILPFIVLGVGPLLISLTSPTPSWMDVLEVNVAPVQRLITFEAFDPQTALPSALYSVNRATPLYTAWFGLSGQLANLEAYEVLAASLVPMLLITLLAAYRLGKVLLPENRHAGWMAALSWVLTCNYLQLQSARSTVWQMTFTLIALTKAVELTRNPASFRLLVECAVVSAASVLAHPLEGMFTVLAVLCLAVFALARDRFANMRRFAAALIIGIGAGAPILWTWWPDSNSAIVLGITLLLLIPLAVTIGTRSPAVPVSRRDLTNISKWVPVIAVVSTVLLRWDFHGTLRRSYIMQELMRYPVSTSLTIAVVFVAIFKKRFSTAALLAGASLLAATAPLWIVRLMEFDPVTTASLRYELALKSTEYWLSGIIAICGSMLLAALWERESRRQPLIRVLSLALLVISVPTVLRIPVGEVHRAAGIYGMWKWQIRLAGEGYWGGWRRRTIVGRDDHELYRELRTLVDSGQIRLTDRIAHVSEYPDLRATPFPAFTGIAQDLYLPSVDSTNIHTFSGRLHDLDQRAPRSGWILIERSMLPRFNIDAAEIVFQNKRATLIRRLNTGT